MYRFAFAGFRHPHIFSFYEMVKADPHAEIVGCFEADPEARAQAEARGVTFTYRTYEELLADPAAEIVAIGDYYTARGGLAIAALKAGKHVFADKPLCTSLTELDEIEAVSGRTGLKVGCMLDLRYMPWVETARKLIADGTLGELRQAFFSGQHPLQYGRRSAWYFEEGKHGGTINDLAVHGIDMLYCLTGLRVKDVLAARTWNAGLPQVPYFHDGAQFMLTLENGAGVQGDVSYSAPDSMGYVLPTYWRFTLWGSRGMMEFSANDSRLLLALNGESEPRYLETKADGSQNCLTVFLDELAGKPTPINTRTVLTVTRSTLEIQAAADRSAR